MSWNAFRPSHLKACTFKPVICSDFPFHREIYKDNPIYFEGGNHFSLYQNIIKIYYMDIKKLRNRLHKAHQYTLSLPSSNIRTSQYNKIVKLSKISFNDKSKHFL